MNITPELIERYAAGSCNDKEVKLVEEWLGSSDLLNPSEMKTSELTALKEGIWLNVRPQNSRLKIGFKLVIITSAAAACMAILFLKTTKEITTDNRTGLTDREMVMNDITIIVKPSSYAKATNLDKNLDLQLKFCGLLKVSGEADRKIELLNDCDLKFSASYKMRKGAKYYAFLAKNDQGESSVFFVNNQDMINLYPPLRLELQRKYDI